jgi:hypothetical protein
MFDSLDEQIRADEHKMTSNAERTVRWLIVGVIAILVFGGLYWGVMMMEGS